MSLLLRATELIKRPVVTLDGEDVAQVKDVIYASGPGALIGFTLNKRGMLKGPLKEVLLFDDVHGVGRDAVMVSAPDVFQSRDALTAKGADDRSVIGARVLTDTGTDLGTITEVIVEVRPDQADIVGYEVEASASLRSDERRVLIPLPDTLAVSGENLIVPGAATEFVRDDLTGFGAAVSDFRAQLERSPQ